MQGMVLTSDSAARQLKNMNRDYNNKLTWQNALNSVDASATQAQQQLQQSYTDASAQAYAAYLQNRAALANSGYIGAGAKALGASADNELTQLYEQYASNRTNQLSAIETARQEQQDAIEDILAQQGEYIAKYDKAHYDYLNWLYENKPEYFEEGGIFEDMMYISDDEDNPEIRLKTMNELFMPSTNEAGEQTGLYRELYDENGNPTGEYELTLKGVDWYDRIENQLNGLQGNKDFKDAGNYTFGEYLSQTDEDLLNWAQSYNPWNYTEAGTNAGTFKTMYGMASTDTSYAFAERFGGLTKGELEQGFKDFSEAMDVGNRDKLTDSVFDLIGKFGLKDEFEEDGLTKETLSKVIKSIGDGEKAEEIADKYLVPNWIIGTLLGPVGMLAAGHETAADKREYERLYREGYNDLLTQITSAAMQKRRQQEIDFTTGNYR